MTEADKRALEAAMLLPGAQAHLNRVKASWRYREPSEEILATWMRHWLARGITRKILRGSLDEVFEIYRAIEADKE